MCPAFETCQSRPKVLSGEPRGEIFFLPQPEQVGVADVVGSDLYPSTGPHHPQDSLHTDTLWGELADRWVSPAGHALAGESERSRAAPGTGLFEEWIGGQPTLIMLDEIARHRGVAQIVPQATDKSDSSEQTVAFLMSLCEFFPSRDQAVIVLALADAFGQETERLRQRSVEPRRSSAWQERVVTPTAGAEIVAIVRYHLFAHVLKRRVSTIPDSRRTRRAWRLLSLVVHHRWQQCPPNAWLIHPRHVDRAVPAILEDLPSRLERSVGCDRSSDRTLHYSGDPSSSSGSHGVRRRTIAS
jgi:hypothetical protein